ncbi:MAG: sarcosine oxidase subunit alpha family protein, partial [Alphaproteobacteria bacterium]
PLAFPCNDVPGVMLASAVRDYLVNWGVSIGDRTVIVTNNDDAYRTAIALHEAGLEVPAVLDARPRIEGALPERARALGIRVEAGRGIARVLGSRRVTGVEVCLAEGEGAVLETISCDAVAMSGGWSPVVHLWSHCGGKLIWDEARALFRPDPDRPPTGADGQGFVRCAGAANGALHASEVLADADAAAREALRALGGRVGRVRVPEGEAEAEAPLEPVWVMPAGADRARKMKMWLDFQNDVKVSDVELAAQEGYESVEHAKRYTTLGMATDQGKLSNINGLAVLAMSRGDPIPEVGTTTFRPPWVPVTFGAIAGTARGPLFKPVRRTPMHHWHEAHGADWEPVGDWRRPYCYRRAGESREGAVRREVLAVRGSVGLLDASTLGKIIVRGPDAGRFLDMLYTNMMSTLKPGRCRYGLMCNENGFLFDDGVVVRLDEQTFLCHTTSGGAERVHGWMEEWLQTEWWDWKVWTAHVTEQFAQIAIVGPKAREVLRRLGVEGADISAEGLPFMHWTEARVAGIPARIYRISFSGELSYEIAVPASRGLELWEAALEAGAEFGITPYGTEALHVMRAEKGFIMIGDETDGTVTPQDLGLDWAISKKKADYLGKRAQERPELTRPDRWKLVGLETLDPEVVLPDGIYATDHTTNAHGQQRSIGRVTSSYWSPTLGRSIAMGLVERGPERMGEVLDFVRTDGGIIKARICDPVFYDKEGARQNV